MRSYRSGRKPPRVYLSTINAFGGVGERLPMPFEVVTDSDEMTAEEVLALYQDHEWWDDRTETDVERAIAETDVLVGLRDTETDRLIASTRVLTDFTYYARIYDVIVATDRRDEGVGKRLMDAVVDRPELQPVVTLHLGCRPDLVPFYEKAGFNVRDLDTEHETMVLRRTDF